MDQVLVFWPTAELEAIGEAAAFEAGRLIADERVWVRRRVEKFTFVDGSRVRRSMSVDFMTPNVPEASVLLVPLALPRKAPLRDLDVRDESGTALSVLTRDENAAISRMILQQYATETLRLTRRFARLHDGLLFDFADIAGHRYEGERPADEQRAARVRSALDLFRRAASVPAPATEPEQQRQALWRDDDMRAFLHLLADRYLFLVRLEARPNERRLVKFAYEEVVERKEGFGFLAFLRRGWATGREALGLAPHKFSFVTSGLYSGNSYHVEVEVPEDLVVRRAQLSRAVEYVDTRAHGRKKGESVDIDTEWNVRRVHLYSSGLEAGAGTRPWPMHHDASEVAHVDLDLVLRSGQLVPPLVISLMTTGVLVGGLLARWEGVRPDGSTAAALLVAAPGLFAAYLVPGGHHLVRRMFRGLRALILLSAVLSFSAGGSLALGLSTRQTAAAWIVLGVLSCGISWVLVRAWRFSLRGH